jgi:hypothetical protein
MTKPLALRFFASTFPSITLLVEAGATNHALPTTKLQLRGAAASGVPAEDRNLEKVTTECYIIFGEISEIQCPN